MAVGRLTNPQARSGPWKDRGHRGGGGVAQRTAYEEVISTSQGLDLAFQQSSRSPLLLVHDSLTTTNVTISNKNITLTETAHNFNPRTGSLCGWPWYTWSPWILELI